ncbi:MAG TPA: DUF1707 domain-containing protein [Pseudonocardiaceae bacterium]|nr:DUF1707 domain-containing protein [Pseudonocardiaceae bacterium]
MNSEPEYQETTIRASDAERERYAAIIGTATGDGRLTAVEAEERLTAVYATRFRHELDPLIADLPEAAAQRPEPVPAMGAGTVSGARRLNWRRGPLAVHLAIVVAIGALLVTRWATMGAGFFWPIMPMLWLGGSLLIHARIRRARAGWPQGFGRRPVDVR